MQLLIGTELEDAENYRYLCCQPGCSNPLFAKFTGVTKPFNLQEIEMVIARLEQESAQTREECERAAENRIKYAPFLPPYFSYPSSLPSLTL